MLLYERHAFLIQCGLVVGEGSLQQGDDSVCNNQDSIGDRVLLVNTRTPYRSSGNSSCIEHRAARQALVNAIRPFKQASFHLGGRDPYFRGPRL